MPRSFRAEASYDIKRAWKLSVYHNIEALDCPTLLINHLAHAFWYMCIAHRTGIAPIRQAHIYTSMSVWFIIISPEIVEISILNNNQTLLSKNLCPPRAAPLHRLRDYRRRG